MKGNNGRGTLCEKVWQDSCGIRSMSTSCLTFQPRLGIAQAGLHLIGTLYEMHDANAYICSLEKRFLLLVVSGS